MKKSVSVSVVAVLLAVIVCVFSACGNSENKITALQIDKNKFECKMDMNDALKLLKDYEYKYYESISCEYDGLDKIYDFSDAGFIFYTYPDGDKDYVLEITVSSENIKQLGGKIYNGMSADELKNILGEEYTKEGKTLSYKMNDEITFSALPSDDGKIIEYTLSAAK